jgi:chemotaxis response regulator CheB
MAALDAPRTVHVLIVDDNAWFRDWESKFLGEQAGIYVVGTAASADEAIQMARDLRPDLVLMGVAMRGVNGLEATLRIKPKPGRRRWSS